MKYAWIWDGQLQKVLERLRALSKKLGPPKPADGPDHPRRVLALNMA